MFDTLLWQIAEQRRKANIDKQNIQVVRRRKRAYWEYICAWQKSATPGTLRQWDGSQYRTLGEYVRDVTTIREATFIAKAFWYSDYNDLGSTSEMNALFEFSTPINLYDVSVGVMEKYAIICAGGLTTDTYYPAFRNDLKDTHDKLIGYGWQEGNIYAYLWDKPAGDFIGLDGPCSDTNVVNAFADVGTKITADDFFFFMVISHGNNDNPNTWFGLGPANPWNWVYIKNVPGQNSLPSSKYAGQIGTTPVRSVWLIHCCYSGNEPFEALGMNAPGRIVISATQDRNEETATLGLDHWGLFKAPLYDGFALSMGSFGNPQSVGYAFNKGQYAANHNGQWTSYHPRMLSYWCDAYTTYW